MLQRFLLCTLLSLFITAALSAQHYNPGHILVQTELNSSYWFGGNTSDGGLIFAGNHYAPGGNGLKQLLIVKTNTTDVEWQRTVDAAQIGAVKETSDGGIVIVGGVGRSTWDVMVMKLDENGGPEWQVSWPKGYRNYGEDVVETEEGSFIITGTVESYETGTMQRDIHVAKVSSQGEVLWTRQLGDEGMTEYAAGVLATSDGGALLLCTEYDGGSFSDGRARILLIRLDKDGHIKKTIRYGGKNEQLRGSSIIKKGNSYIISGEYISSDLKKWYALLMGVNRDGKVIWSKGVAPQGNAYNGKQLVATNKGYALLMHSYPLRYVYLVEFDQTWDEYSISGELLWGKGLWKLGLSGTTLFDHQFTRTGWLHDCGRNAVWILQAIHHSYRSKWQRRL